MSRTALFAVGKSRKRGAASLSELVRLVIGARGADRPWGSDPDATGG